MSKDKIADYDGATAGNNTDIGGISIAEGMLPSAVNNSMRELTRQLGAFADGTDAIDALSVTGSISAADASLSGTGAIKVPVGTTLERPTPAQGQIRYNTTDGSFEGYDGSAWGAIGGSSGEASLILYEYTATSGQTTFSGADDNAATLSYTVNNIQVVMNGVILDPSDYTATTGTSVVLASGAALNDIVNIYAFQSFTVADTVSASAGGTFNANVAINGDLTADGLTVDGGASASTSYFRFAEYLDGFGYNGAYAEYDGSNNELIFGRHNTSDTNTANDIPVMSFQRETGDISFYDSTGTTQGFFWDASTQSLGLGDTAPDTPVHINKTIDVAYTPTATTANANNLLKLENPSSTAGVFAGVMFRTGSGADGGINWVQGSGNDGSFTFTNQNTTDVEMMRIQSDGNVGIGTTSPSDKLHVEGDIRVNNAIESANNLNLEAENGELRFYTGSGSPSEAARINSSGHVLMGTTTSISGGGQLQVKRNSTSRIISTQSYNTSNQYHHTFVNNSGSLVGNISVSTTATSYNTSSDYRLKENVVADWDATTRLKQLNPVRFNFIADPDTTVDGFLAHEVQDIVPEAISGTKDAMRDEEYEVTPAVLDEDGNVVTPAVMGTRSVPEYQGIDQSKLVPLLVKTIQELEARIAALENA